MLTLVIFSKFWVLFLLAFFFMKFGCAGRYKKCSGKNEYRKDPTPPKHEPPFEDKDIVPDGQSGF